MQHPFMESSYSAMVGGWWLVVDVDVVVKFPFPIQSLLTCVGCMLQKVPARAEFPMLSAPTAL